MVSDWKSNPYNDGRYQFPNYTLLSICGRGRPSRTGYASTTIRAASWNGPFSRVSARRSPYLFASWVPPCGARTWTTSPTIPSSESSTRNLQETATITGCQAFATLSTLHIITRSGTALLLNPDPTNPSLPTGTTVHITPALTATVPKLTSFLPIDIATSPTTTAGPAAFSTTVATKSSFSQQADLAKQTLGSSAAPTPSLVSPVQSSPHPSTARVVGATVGSLAALAILLLLALVFLRRRRRRRQNRKRRLLPETAEIQPARAFPSWPSRLSMYLPGSPTPTPYADDDARHQAQQQLGASRFLPSRFSTAPPLVSAPPPPRFATPIYESFRSRTDPFSAILQSSPPLQPSSSSLFAAGGGGGGGGGRRLETIFIPPSPAISDHRNPGTALPDLLARPALAAAASRSRSRASSVTSRVVSSRFSLDSRGERRKSDPFDLEGAG